MFKSIKRAAQIGAGVLVLTALTSAVAGYFFGKRRANDYSYDYDSDDHDDGDGGGSNRNGNGGGGFNRRQAVRDMVSAGKDMKNAWNRIQRDAKIIARQTVSAATDLDSDENEG